MAQPPSRMSFAGDLWREGLWGKWIGGAWAAYGGYLQVKDQIPATASPLVGVVIAMIPTVSFEVWVSGALLVILAWCFEASFRVQRKAFTKYAELEATVAAISEEPLKKRQALLAEHKVNDGRELVRAVTEIEALAKTPTTGLAEVLDALNAKDALAKLLHSERIDLLWSGFGVASIQFVVTRPQPNAFGADPKFGPRLMLHSKQEGGDMKLAADLLREELLKMS